MTPTIFFMKIKKVSRAEYVILAISLAYLSSGRQQKKVNETNSLFLPPPPPLLKILVKKNNRPQTSPYVWREIVPFIYYYSINLANPRSTSRHQFLLVREPRKAYNGFSTPNTGIIPWHSLKLVNAENVTKIFL